MSQSATYQRPRTDSSVKHSNVQSAPKGAVLKKVASLRIEEDQDTNKKTTKNKKNKKTKNQKNLNKKNLNADDERLANEDLNHDDSKIKPSTKTNENSHVKGVATKKPRAGKPKTKVANQPASQPSQEDEDIDVSDIDTHTKLTRTDRLAREQACERLAKAHGQVYVPKDSKYMVIGNAQASNYDDCIPLEYAVPGHVDKDELGIVYRGIHNKHVCNEVKGHWYTDPLEKGEEGIDVCLVRKEDADCISGQSQTCTQVGNYREVFGKLSGRRVGADKARQIRNLLKGRLPAEWPSLYNNDRLPVDGAVARFFSDRMSTPPMNSNVPYGGPATTEQKQKACGGRQVENLASMRVQRHQAVIYTVMQVLARTIPPAVQNGRTQERGIIPRGILAWHSTGSGKTAVAAGVAEAFWHARCPSDPSKLRPVIFLCSVDGIKSNPPAQFAKEARRFFKPKWKVEYIRAKAIDQRATTCVEDVQSRKMATFYTASHMHGGHSRMVLMTFKEMANRLGIVDGRIKIANEDPYFAKDAVLIIDEVHNLFKPLAGQEKDNTALRKWLLSRNFEEQKGDIKIVIMTATPGETIPQMQSLLQIIQDPGKPRITVPQMHDVEGFAKFGKSIRGLVSFMDLSHDKSKFPSITSSNGSNGDLVPCVMDKTHATEYLKVYDSFVASLNDLNDHIIGILKKEMKTNPGGQAANHKKPTSAKPYRDVFDFAEKVVTAGKVDEHDDDGTDVDKKKDLEKEPRNRSSTDALMRAALKNYKDLRKLSIWSAGASTKKELTSSRNLAETSKVSPKTTALIKLLQQYPNAKHYAYSEFATSSHGTRGWTPGMQAIGLNMEKHGYVRIWSDEVKDILKLLGMSVAVSKEEKNASASIKKSSKASGAKASSNSVAHCFSGNAANNGTKNSNIDTRKSTKDTEKSTNTGKNSSIILATQQNNKATLAKEEADRHASIQKKRKLVDDYFMKKGINTANAKFYVVLASTGFRKRPLGNDYDTSAKCVLPAQDLDLAAKYIMTLYNAPDNVTGRLLHVILASGKYNESIDLHAVQHLHFLNPFMSMASEMQAIGRARRNCSHASLGFIADWTVSIHRYISLLPDGMVYGSTSKVKTKTEPTNKGPRFNFYPRGRETIDHVMEVSKKRANNQLEILNEIIKRRAVDCELFSGFHKGVKCNEDERSLIEKITGLQSSQTTTDPAQNQSRNKEARNKELRNKELRNKETRNKEARNKETRNKETRNREARNKDQAVQRRRLELQQLYKRQDALRRNNSIRANRNPSSLDGRVMPLTQGLSRLPGFARSGALSGSNSIRRVPPPPQKLTQWHSKNENDRKPWARLIPKRSQSMPLSRVPPPPTRSLTF